MKQIKGEPWPPGETLAGSRDGIQMGNHEGIIQGFWDLFFPHNNLIIIKVCFVFCIIKNRIFKKCGGGDNQNAKCRCPGRKEKSCQLLSTVFGLLKRVGPWSRSSGCLASATEASRKRECPSRHVSQPVSSSAAAAAACPVCQRAPPALPHGFYLSVSRWVFDALRPPPPSHLLMWC